jgi:hypothetical protein
VTDDPRMAAARIEVARTREALIETARELQGRLAPKAIASDVWEKAKDKGADLAEGAVDAVAKRPLAVGGVIAALTMFLAREPIKAATVKFYDVMTPLFEPRSKPAALKARKSASKPKPPARRPARPARRATPKKTEKA